MAVIVTGAGSGIGRATALAFAAQGAPVLIADLNAEGAAQTAKLADGPTVTVVGDLSEQAVVDRVVATAAEEFGGITTLINNAGVMDSMSPVGQVGDAEWERIIRINLTAPFMLTRAALPHLLAGGGGTIVNVASEAGLRGSAAGAAYTAAKHGVIGLTRSLAVTYRERGLRTNAVAPGGVVTSIMSGLSLNQEGMDVLLPFHGAAGRIAEPEQIAAAIMFLASDAAAHVNGVILPVDWGWSAI
ncbi:SDR family NAD(P)-dependent oxidoreductase [Nonomuraea sp. LPB2021202275-12-8]|uniref:SDR family NAD(P)-dependent oxidoreductase n=1 Tax=Nonomuraea sp. LPB2021202275-12-8 TaxID=3120159 RepID=UPI00300D72B0